MSYKLKNFFPYALEVKEYSKILLYIVQMLDIYDAYQYYYLPTAVFVAKFNTVKFSVEVKGPSQ